MYDATDLITSLIITILVYSLPLWIYKLAVKDNISKKKAKRITIIYAIFAYIFMFGLLYSSGSAPSVGPILLWSFINYKVLSKGTKDNCSVSNDIEEYNLSDNSGYYEGILSNEDNVIQKAKAYLDFTNDGKVYLSNYIDNDGKLHTLSSQKEYTLEDVKNGITHKFDLIKNNTSKTYNLTIPGFDYYGNDEGIAKIRIFNCEQIKIYEEISKTLDTTQYPPYLYTDDEGYYFAIEKNTNDKKLCVCTPKEWVDFVKPIVDEITDISYSDFLKYALDNLPDKFGN